MLNTHHLMQALEAAGADHNVVYVSVPITSGRREFALLKEVGLTSSASLRTRYRDRWLREVVALNAEEARQHAAQVRDAPWTQGAVVVDPSRMQVEGWEQDDYNAFWVELMARHVRRLVVAPDWAVSRGARGEVAYAMALNLEIVDLSGRPCWQDELEREGDAARSALLAEGWPVDDVDRMLPPLHSLRQPQLRPSAQSEVFYWLGAERKRQVDMFGPETDDLHTREDGLRAGGWWERQLARYWERARAEGIAREKGRVILARYVATACALLESAVRQYGSLPPPQANDEHG